MGEVKHAVDGTVKGVKHAAEGVVKGAKKTWNVAKNAYIPSVQEIEDAAAHSFHRGTKKAKKSTEETAKTAAKTAKDWGKQSSEWIMDNVAIPKEFAYKFPWSPCGPRRRTSVWDFFKTLVDEYRHFWWTQQWLSGYLAWAVFVGIESKLFSVSAIIGSSRRRGSGVEADNVPRSQPKPAAEAVFRLHGARLLFQSGGHAVALLRYAASSAGTSETPAAKLGAGQSRRRCADRARDACHYALAEGATLGRAAVGFEVFQDGGAVQRCQVVQLRSGLRHSLACTHCCGDAGKQLGQLQSEQKRADEACRHICPYPGVRGSARSPRPRSTSPSCGTSSQ